jgi:hypothetical protein
MVKAKTDQLLPFHLFMKRLILNFIFANIMVAVALGLGMLGYHTYEHMHWVDAFLNASMILSGMGPASSLVTESGKIFAGCYALFSGLAFIVIMGVIFAPILHRLLHKVHLDIT